MGDAIDHDQSALIQRNPALFQNLSDAEPVFSLHRHRLVFSLRGQVAGQGREQFDGQFHRCINI